MMRLFLAFALLLPLVTSISRPQISPLSPRGVRFEIKDEGYQLVALHYSINDPVRGVQAGKFNFDLNTREGGKWIHENSAVTLHPNDVINYWVYVTINGRAQQLLDQSWTMPGATAKPVHRETTKQPVHTNHNHATQKPANTGHAQTKTNTHVDHQQQSCSQYPCLIFEDDFDFLDHEVWQHELTLGGGGNWEFQHYTNNRSNSYTRNGVLYIKPTLTADAHDDAFLEHGELDIWGGGPHDTCTGNNFYGCKRVGSPTNVLNPIQSARLRSSRGFNFKYGKVEVDAKLPTGDWIWPAIWMMPTFDVYGTWPASGEIDIMESRGNLNYRDERGQPAGVDRVGSTLHFGPDWLHDAYPKATASKVLHSGTFGDRFHRYGVEWDEDTIRFTIDDEEILRTTPDNEGFWKYGDFAKTGLTNPWVSGTKMAPFDQKYYIILNVAVGGMNYFPDNYQGPRPKPWKNADNTAFWRAKNQWYPTWNPSQNNGEDAALQINHVKVWKMKP